MNAPRATFFPLTVGDVRRTTRDAVAVTLEPPPGAPFEFRPGQYLTFRRDFAGTEIRRSYSICSGVDEPLRVGIKRVEGGAFSAWANDALRPGDVLDAMPPQGRFGPEIEAGARHAYLGFAGGSGITPVLSILRSVLEGEPESRFALIYANRSAASVMFRDELEDLKNRHMGRLQVIHVLSQGAPEAPLLSGRLDAERCDALLSRLVDVGGTDAAFLCGPEGLMETAAAALGRHGMARGRIRRERFAAGQPGRLPRAARAAAQARAATRLTVVLDGAAHGLEVAPGQTVLEAALAAGLDAPWSCRAGVCSTCRCRVLEGAVEMAANHALEDDEVAAGFALSCQSLPVGEALTVSYDAAH
jgi:ring-1,2-phenylacetyl-CoA epoxidase subunit PaaE